ncbi:MAG: hypothetical protein ACE5PV_07890 [Candidatus Poribacteria bacterium]
MSIINKQLSKDIVAKVKNEDSVIYKEIEALCSITKPIKGYDKEKGPVYSVYLSLDKIDCNMIVLDKNLQIDEGGKYAFNHYWL